MPRIMRRMKDPDGAAEVKGEGLPEALAGRIGFLLARSAGRVREMAEEALTPLGILPRHYGVISAIRHAGHITQQSVGKMLNIDRTTMVWLVDELERKGLVSRGVHPRDRRCHLLCLNPSGHRLFQEAVRRMEQREKELLTPLTAEERDELRRILTKLFGNTGMEKGRSSGSTAGRKR